MKVYMANVLLRYGVLQSYHRITDGLKITGFAF